EEAYLFDHTVGRIGNKLTKRWTGPWIVKELRGKNAAVLEREGRTTVQNISAIMPIGPKWDPEDMKRGPVGGPDELMEGEGRSEVTERLSEKATTAQLDDDRIRKQFHEEIGARKKEAKEGKKLAEGKKAESKEEAKQRRQSRRSRRKEQEKTVEDMKKEGQPEKKRKNMLEIQKMPELPRKQDPYDIKDLEVGTM